MHTSRLSAILLAAALVACSDEAPTAAKVTPTEPQLAVGANNKQRTQSIEDLVATFEAATAASDLEALLALFAEDVEAITAGGTVFSGRAAYAAYIGAFLGGPFGSALQDITLRWVTFLTGTIAVVDVDIVYSVPPLPPGLRPTEPGILRARGRWVVVKRGGEWLIVALQTTPIPPAS